MSSRVGGGGNAKKFVSILRSVKDLSIEELRIKCEKYKIDNNIKERFTLDKNGLYNYYDASDICRINKIKTREAYRKYRERFNKHLPYSPDEKYKKYWVNWDSFLWR